MLRHCLILSVALLSVVASFGAMSASADVLIYSEDFEAGAGGWTSASFFDAANNSDEPTDTSSVTSPGLDGSTSGYTLESGFFDETTNTSWAGTQISSPGSGIAGSAFAPYALSDITLSFDVALTDLTNNGSGNNENILFEIRESGAAGTTHQLRFSPADLAGTELPVSFTLDQNQTNGFSGAFDPNETKQLFIQLSDGWQLVGGTRDISLTADNFLITAPDAVPEPSSLVILGSIGLLGMVRRRR